MCAAKALRIHGTDNVLVATVPVSAGDSVEYSGGTLQVMEDIPRGHKIALVDIPVQDNIMKYGYQIGHATVDIRKGQWVHTHNAKTNLSGKEEYRYQPSVTRPSERIIDLPASFDGYVRENGDVGVRNEIWILNTVGCVNKAAETLAKMADSELRGDGIDGVYHFAHPYGCSQLGDDLLYTQKALAGLVRHPNAAGVLVLGLGCENNRIQEFRPFLNDVPEEKIRFLALQDIEDEFEEGMRLLRELADYARTFKREKVPVSRLKIGLKCGGSDGFSGITANPLVGALSDLVVAQGGTSLLTEVPEMFGAETILMNRAVDDRVFGDVVSLINDFKDYYTRHHQVIYENPSPGNKDGGITTLEEKSLGCIQKGGTSPVVDVVPYGISATKPGLSLVQAPGNDMVSVTALTTAGAHMVLFTTGRGTPMGAAVPTVKISTNTSLYEKKRNWIDFNAGSLVEGDDMQSLAASLYNTMIDIASGRVQTRNEKNGFREIAIFKDGVTL
ncbi:altronate dehydratase family protein [Alicyclobacillus fastidiosus]|uniref:Altronate dehydratase family protein n=1 Tax=Alicyclobacillus fastidiosus TaxID=392011 RepID=A0ABY6ZFJ2_9BACL|nr:altronate dehydratase family protein [Alicyclobacillus fastidiosus]WAH41272.1 altronate dehydratase family protein [Alicyclobacillus fastidiosus]GMA62869.1 altronate hydrolase [Alicyclobacillus fastidiosus]